MSMLTPQEELRKKEMSDQIAALEKQLQERIVALDHQRKEEAERFANEVATRNAVAEMERAENLRKHQEAEYKKRAQKEAKVIAEQQRAQEEFRLRKQLENDLALAEESKRLQQEKLQWLVNEIAKQEFIEEQHRKAMQSQNVNSSEPIDTASINVEHPLAPDNKGEAVQGTEGSTPESPLISAHLKHILRQATRTY
jgi:hypothetical protein